MTQERPKSVVDAHVLLIKGGTVLLLRRQNTGFEDGKLCLISGHLEAGEPVIEAARREAMEEAGIDVHLDDLEFVHVMHNNSGGHRMAFFFEASSWHGEARNAEPDKCSEIVWASLEDLPEDIIPYQREAIIHALNGNIFSCRGWQKPEGE